MDLQMATHLGTILSQAASLCCPKQALGAKMNPKAPPRASKPQNSSILGGFWIDFVMIFRVM